MVDRGGRLCFWILGVQGVSNALFLPLIWMRMTVHEVMPLGGLRFARPWTPSPNFVVPSRQRGAIGGVPEHKRPRLVRGHTECRGCMEGPRSCGSRPWSPESQEARPTDVEHPPEGWRLFDHRLVNGCRFFYILVLVMAAAWMRRVLGDGRRIDVGCREVEVFADSGSTRDPPWTDHTLIHP